MSEINKLFEESINVKQEILNSNILNVIERMGDEISHSIKNGGKMMLCGNGGSAADAQHLAAEMLIRLRPNYNRQGVPAIALAQDVSTITACSNDFGFDHLFERVLESLGNSGDVLIAITTSGNSMNVIKAMQLAREMNIIVFGFLGAGGGKALEFCDEAFLVPSSDTGRIQESHITAGHALMEYIEDQLLQDGFLELNKTLNK
jgi:D-sedoheptulose 7-phosphate isomerase